MFPVAGTFHPAEDTGQSGQAREEPGEREQNFLKLILLISNLPNTRATSNRQGQLQDTNKINTKREIV